MELLTWTQFAERFPIEGSSDSAEAWGKLLKRYRDEGKLRERRGPDDPKWDYRTLPSSVGRPTKHYNLRSVVVVVCREAQSGRPKTLSSYLADEYYNQFCEILQAKNGSAPSAATPTEKG